MSPAPNANPNATKPPLDVKIFGVGLNKTGTVSLAQALRQLGFRVLHDNKRGKAIVADIAAGNSPPELDQYDVFLDAPYWEVCQQLDAMLGDKGRFILTTREIESWVTSRMMHILSNRLADDPTVGWRDGGTWHCRNLYAEIHSAVRSHFGADPRLLEIDICAGDGWAKLCGWLGLTVPNAAFPKVNSGHARLEAAIIKAKERK